MAWLKRWTEEAVATRLTVEPAMDAMKLAGLCDALRLYLRPAVRSLPERPWHHELSEDWCFAASPVRPAAAPHLLHESTTSTSEMLL